MTRDQMPLPTAAPPRAHSVRFLLGTWFALGLQSFGGGSSTLALIRAAFVDRLRVVSSEEFAELFALCQLSPGINLLGLMVLIGRKTHGAIGIAAALLGFLLPSVALTIVITALYARIQHLAWITAAIKGIVPATVGIGLAVSAQMIVPMLKSARRDGRAALMAAAVVIVASSAAALAFPRSTALILVGGGLIGAVASGFGSRKDDTA